ncbi:MAG: RagB/SusD family nutrient uptake outer membrane protein [Flavobacteriaceae bacterium]|nr:MAG: RagB/SusD family nutrient uptake outer membrane protein [Flavobacteriaceae bacterium]
MNLKNKSIVLLLSSISLFMSCEDYLDIVPDGTQELSLLFNRKETAYNALTNCYSYLPQNDGTYASYVLASDELAVPVPKETNAIKLMKGQQNVSSPLMGYWSGFSADGRGQGSLWEGIRSCNILIDNIDLVVDMDQEEKNQWKAEAKFLKAYFHFLLVSNYGPIPIVDVNLPISASDTEVRVKRKKVDECFSYIVETIDAAISDLPERVLGNNDLGRIDQVIAKAIKAKALLYSASPLFNGNSAFYANFLNVQGEHFFNQSYEASKWELAANAAQEAIDAATAQGASLYYFMGTPPLFDTNNFQFQLVRDQYNHRFAVTDPWNSELLWGNSSPVTNGDWWQIQSPALMKDPTSSSVEAAWQWLSPSLRMVETYYTRNGLPIEEDLSFEYTDRYATTTVAFNQRFYAQFANRTAKLNLNRESRFYASLGFDRGINRTWGSIWNLKMRKGELHGRIANTGDYLTTGYALKKIVHQDSEGDAYTKAVTYPWPMIRLSELYLSYAEALNEFSGPSAEVYDALNKIRARAGIPTVQDAWSNAAYAATLNKHTNKEGLREIIQQERTIELAFEGHRYYDIRRWKLAELYFTSPIKGWSVDEETEANYYQIMDVSQRSFNSPRDYLQPISFTELSRNPNLIQNPGW